MSLVVVHSGICGNPEAEYLEEINKTLSESNGRELIVIVPDSFSYIAERNVCRTVGGTGISGVSVMTFHQLVRRLVDTGDTLSSVGKQMLIKKIVSEGLEEDNVFFAAKDRTGFAESVVEIMNDWKRFGVDVGSLEKEAKASGNGMSARKISALAEIYREYTALFEQKGFFDESELLSRVAFSVQNLEELRNSFVWIDGFSDFTPAELGVIRAFLQNGAMVKIYLPSSPTPEEINGGVYDIPRQTVTNLKKMCTESGISCSECTLEEESHGNKVIRFLCDNYDTEEKFSGFADGIMLKTAGDIYSEAEFAASKIVDLVTDEGYNFSDISVLCGNINEYSPCIESVFERYKIPYFSDYKVPLINHPVSILLLCVFDIVNKKSFQGNRVIRYLKTGYILKNDNDVDLISVYVTKHGIVGSMWFDDKYFINASKSYFADIMGMEAVPVPDGERLAALRAEITKPLSDYYEASKGKLSVKEHTVAFFEYLKKINLFDKIERRVTDFEESGEENEAARLTHVWNVLVDIFDQMVLGMGDDIVTREEFGSLLKAGIEGSEISIIPTVTNGVSVSDAGGRTGEKVKALFILGASRDTVPQVKKEDGIVNENDIAQFSSLPEKCGKTYKNQTKEFELLRAVADASELLYISCAEMNANGDKVEQSPLFDKLSGIFPEITGDRYIDSDLFISAPEVMFHKLLMRLTDEKELNITYRCVRDWFMEQSEWKNTFEILQEAEDYCTLKGMISKEMSYELYKSITAYSVSRIEKYFKCPFSYFLSYGLRLDDGEAFGMKSTDTGDIVHLAISEFCSRVEGDAPGTDIKKHWDSVDDKKIREIVSEIMSEYRERATEDIKTELVLGRVEATVLRAARLVAISIREGKYSIFANEHKFEDFKIATTEGEAVFRGVIDRLDVFDEGDTRNVRIVDYKTGIKELSFTKMMNGIDMQLMIYAMAAEDFFGENSEIAGIFYNNLKNKIKSAQSAEEGAKELVKSERLNGTVFENMEENNLEVKTGADMDRNLIPNGESSFLPLKLKSGGVYAAAACALSHDMYTRIKNSIKELVVDASEKIKSGDVRVYPYSAGEYDNACAYCQYKNICMYDMCKGAGVNNGSEGKARFENLCEN